MEIGGLAPLLLAFAGIALFAAVAALSHEHERAFSASIIYLVLGAAAAVVLAAAGVDAPDPVSHPALFEHVTEVAIAIAVFSTGLSLGRPLSTHEWRTPARLLLVALPLTIAAVAAFGVWAMGLPLGAAIVLGAALAPTDPVLAGDVGSGPPAEDDSNEARFALSGEAGANDGLGLPFLVLGLVVLEDGSIAEWLALDVVYGLGIALVLGWLLGRTIARAISRLRDRELLAAEYEGWFSVACALLVFGAVTALGGVGFLACFAAGLAFRRQETREGLDDEVHGGAEVAEKFSELAVLLLVGTALTTAIFTEPGTAGLLLVGLLLLVLRPAIALASLKGADGTRRERHFVAFFGVRGVAAVYYVAFAAASGALAPGDAATIWWTVAAVVVASVLLHGVTATPLSRFAGATPPPDAREPRDEPPRPSARSATPSRRAGPAPR